MEETSCIFLTALLAVCALAAFPQAAHASTSADMSPVQLLFDSRVVWTESGTVV